MKSCGYRGGWCSSQQFCELTDTSGATFYSMNKLSRLARKCPHFTPYDGGKKLSLRKERRRRDWTIGNPYKVF